MPPGRRSDELGPVQVLLIGIDAPGSGEMLAAELQDLRIQDAVKVLDVLLVRRSFDDEIERLGPPAPGRDEGDLVEALLVVDADPRKATADARPKAREGTETEWFLADRLPRGTAAAILLVEHRWAIPLRAAASQFDAEILGDAWVHPRDLAAARRDVERTRSR